MQITVNGQKETVESGSVLEFVKSKGLDPGKVVVEYNSNIIKRDNWAQVQLAENDTLEVIALVGGG